MSAITIEINENNNSRIEKENVINDISNMKADILKNDENINVNNLLQQIRQLESKNKILDTKNNELDIEHQTLLSKNDTLSLTKISLERHLTNEKNTILQLEKTLQNVLLERNTLLSKISNSNNNEIEASQLNNKIIVLGNIMYIIKYVSTSIIYIYLFYM